MWLKLALLILPSKVGGHVGPSSSDHGDTVGGSRMPKIRALRWWMIALIMLGSILNYLTRSTLAVAAPTILKDLQISAEQYSWILAAFQATIMLQPFAGYMLDVIGLKKGFAIFVTA